MGSQDINKRRNKEIKKQSNKETKKQRNKEIQKFRKFITRARKGAIIEINIFLE